VLYRIIYLENLEIKLNELGAINFFNDSDVNLSYMPKLTVDKVDSTIIEGEIREGRTLFGAHLDDFTIIFKEWFIESCFFINKKDEFPFYLFL